MSEILIHTEPISSSAVRRLSKDGVVAIKVKDLESFKLISVQTQNIRTDDFIWACLDAINLAESSWGDVVRKKFIKNMASLAEENYQAKRLSKKVKS